MVGSPRAGILQEDWEQRGGLGNGLSECVVVPVS